MKVIIISLAITCLCGNLQAETQTADKQTKDLKTLELVVSKARNNCQSEATQFGEVRAQMAYVDNCLRHALVADLAHLEKISDL